MYYSYSRSVKLEFVLLSKKEACLGALFIDDTLFFEYFLPLAVDIFFGVTNHSELFFINTIVQNRYSASTLTQQ